MQSCSSKRRKREELPRGRIRDVPSHTTPPPQKVCVRELYFSRQLTESVLVLDVCASFHYKSIYVNYRSLSPRQRLVAQHASEAPRQLRFELHRLVAVARGLRPARARAHQPSERCAHRPAAQLLPSRRCAPHVPCSQSLVGSLRRRRRPHYSAASPSWSHALLSTRQGRCRRRRRPPTAPTTVPPPRHLQCCAGASSAGSGRTAAPNSSSPSWTICSTRTRRSMMLCMTRA